MAAARFGGVAVDDHAERIDGIAIDQDFHLHQLALAVPDGLIVKGGIAARYGFDAVVKIEDDFVQRQLVNHLRAARDICQV